MSDLLVERDRNVLVLKFNRPERMNALSDEMIATALEAVQSVIERRFVRAILLTGNGRAFCAGADLSELTERRDSVEEYLIGGVNLLVQALHEVPVPVIVALNGAAAGAGCGLALSGDIIVAAKSATLLTAFARLGAVMDGGTSWSLTRKIGAGRAMALAMIGDRPIEAQTAKEWGLVWEVVEDDQLMPCALKLAHRLADGPTIALGIIKGQISSADSFSMAEALRNEAACQGRAFKSDDFYEGVTAFRANRKPKFTGK